MVDGVLTDDYRILVVVRESTRLVRLQNLHQHIVEICQRLVNIVKAVEAGPHFKFAEAMDRCPLRIRDNPDRMDQRIKALSAFGAHSRIIYRHPRYPTVLGLCRQSFCGITLGYVGS